MEPNTIPMSVIARIRTDFPTKFGIPRQSGLVAELEATVVFEPEYRMPEAVRGLEEFSHIWRPIPSACPPCASPASSAIPPWDRCSMWRGRT